MSTGAQDSLENALIGCLYGIELDPSTFVQAAQNFASAGKIDSLSHLNRSKVFLYSGLEDTVVFQAVMKVLQGFYQQVMTNSSAIVTEFNIPSEHCLPTGKLYLY
jgi:hypothetical protein